MKKTFLIFFVFILFLATTPKIIYAYNPDTYLNKEIRYYYEELDPEEQAIYNNLLNAIVNFDEQAEIYCTKPRELYEVFLKLRADFPEIFWVSETYEYSENEGIINMVKIKYVYNIDEIDTIQLVIDETIEEVKEKTEGLSDYVKAKVVFDYVCDKITYNHDTYNAINVDQAFLKGDAICGGFAKMYTIIANGIGIPARMVIGCRTTDATVAHSWNEVFINDKTIYVDCTWGDHTAYMGQGNKYFDMEESIFHKNHVEHIL